MRQSVDILNAVYFNFEKYFLENENFFQKSGAETTKIKMRHFHTKRSYQKPMLRQIEW